MTRARSMTRRRSNICHSASVDSGFARQPRDSREQVRNAAAEMVVAKGEDALERIKKLRVPEFGAAAGNAIEMLEYEAVVQRIVGDAPGNRGEVPGCPHEIAEDD